MNNVPARPSMARPQKQNKEIGDFNRIMNRSSNKPSAIWKPSGQ